MVTTGGGVGGHARLEQVAGRAARVGRGGLVFVASQVVRPRRVAERVNANVAATSGRLVHRSIG